MSNWYTDNPSFSLYSLSSIKALKTIVCMSSIVIPAGHQIRGVNVWASTPATYYCFTTTVCGTKTDITEGTADTGSCPAGSHVDNYEVGLSLLSEPEAGLATGSFGESFGIEIELPVGHKLTGAVLNIAPSIYGVN